MKLLLVHYTVIRWRFQRNTLFSETPCTFEKMTTRGTGCFLLHSFFWVVSHFANPSFDLTSDMFKAFVEAGSEQMTEVCHQIVPIWGACSLSGVRCTSCLLSYDVWPWPHFSGKSWKQSGRGGVAFDWFFALAVFQTKIQIIKVRKPLWSAWPCFFWQKAENNWASPLALAPRGLGH